MIRHTNTPVARLLVGLAAFVVAAAQPIHAFGDSRPAFDAARADELLPEHGRYSHAYSSDWATLPTGDELARRDPATFELQAVVGEDARRVWRDQERVHLSGLQWKVNWSGEKPSKGDTTLFLFQNVGEVVIEDLVIVQNDPDYRGWDTIRVEGADRVIVRNVHLAGPVHSYHLRLEACGDILVDRVEVAGVEFAGKDRGRVGGGVWINNGASKGGLNDTGHYTEHPRLPGWQVVQNSYFHDGADDDNGKRNQDAVLIHSVSHGVLFNCVVENWLRPAMESSFDLSFRSHQPEFQDRHFRVERNVLKNTTFYKNVGNAIGPNTLLWANNVFVNAQLADYHGGGNDAYFVHNTCIYDLDRATPELRELTRRGASGYAALWAFAGRTFLTNSVLFKPDGDFFVFYLNNDPPADKFQQFFPDHNAYALGGANVGWLRTAVEGLKFRTLDDWRQATGKDAHSTLTPADPGVFADYAAGDYRPVGNPWPGVADRRYLQTNDPKMRIDRDFDGRLRSEADDLLPGAFRGGPPGS